MRKKEAIPDLQAHYKEILTRFEEASKAREQRHKADELKKELAWAHVASKQDVGDTLCYCALYMTDMVFSQEVTGKATELHKLQQRIPKIQRSLDGADVRVLLLICVVCSDWDRQNLKRPLPPFRSTRENMKTLAISTI